MRQHENTIAIIIRCDDGLFVDGLDEPLHALLQSYGRFLFVWVPSPLLPEEAKIDQGRSLMSVSPILVTIYPRYSPSQPYVFRTHGMCQVLLVSVY